MRRADRSKTAVSIGQTLSRSRNPIVEEAMDRYRALTPLNTVWTNSVEQPLRRHTHPVTFQDNVLTVHAESSLWANLLRNTEHSVVASLRAAGLHEVRALRIRIKPPEPASATPPAETRDGDERKFRRLFAQLRKALD